MLRIGFIEPLPCGTCNGHPIISYGLDRETIHMQVADFAFDADNYFPTTEIHCDRCGYSVSRRGDDDPAPYRNAEYGEQTYG